jgi:hypothetical protein
MTAAPHTPLTRRVIATQATVDAFRRTAFAWGRNDCARLAAHVLKGLGHKPRLTRFGPYRSPITARKALQRHGFQTLADVLDDLGLPRIPPAAALPGDILGFGHPDQPLLVGLAVAVGNGRLLGFMDNGDGEGQLCHVFAPTFGAAGVDYYAWRADPV